MVEQGLQVTFNPNVWYVDSRASNHMTSHGKWFRDKGFEDNKFCGNW